MKKIYAFLGLSFLLFSASFSFADEHHDIIIQNYKETHPEDQNFYTLETIEGNEDLNNAHLVLTGQELTNNKDHIDALLQRIPHLHLILDVEENDRLVINGSLYLNHHTALHIRKLTIMNLAQDVRAIGNGFLYNCENLTQLNFLFLNNVTRIGNEFLIFCYGLTQLNLSGLSHVTEIGTTFLRQCNGLTQLDLSPLRQVARIKAGFLEGCTGLQQLDLSPLNQATQIGNKFLTNCLNFAEFHQIILPAHNPALEDALKARFLQGTNIGDMIREVYVEGYVPISRSTKRARQ